MSVGLTENEARKKGANIRVVDCEMGELPGAALHTDGYSGHARIIVDEDWKFTIAATFLGP